MCGEREFCRCFCGAGRKAGTQADALFSRILPAIPRKREYDGFEGLIVIENEEHSDFVDSVSKLCLSVAEIEFSVPAAPEETDVPTVKSVEAEPEMG
jgi:hypothetical protein